MKFAIHHINFLSTVQKDQNNVETALHGAVLYTTWKDAKKKLRAPFLTHLSSFVLAIT